MLLCSRCQEEKPEEAFYVDKAKKRGYYSHCKTCHNATVRAYHVAHPEVRAAANKRFRQGNGRQRRITYSASWNQAHPEYFVTYRREHRKEHARNEQKRRALLHGQFIEDVDHHMVYERDQGICGICQAEVTWTDFSLDHIIPISKGGLHSYANTQTSHLACNIAKGVTILEKE